MRRKAKGINAERELIHKFWATNDWASVRVAGSGSIEYPTPDIIASKKGRCLVIECKTSKDGRKYLTKKEVKELITFSEFFLAEPWIGIKFKNKGWYFIETHKLNETEKSYVISFEEMIKKGKKFEEMIK